jgi:hypothetical protein
MDISCSCAAAGCDANAIAIAKITTAQTFTQGKTVPATNPPIAKEKDYDHEPARAQVSAKDGL